MTPSFLLHCIYLYTDFKTVWVWHVKCFQQLKKHELLLHTNIGLNLYMRLLWRFGDSCTSVFSSDATQQCVKNPHTASGWHDAQRVHTPALYDEPYGEDALTAFFFFLFACLLAFCTCRSDTSWWKWSLSDSLRRISFPGQRLWVIVTRFHHILLKADQVGYGEELWQDLKKQATSGVMAPLIKACDKYAQKCLFKYL